MQVIKAVTACMILFSLAACVTTMGTNASPSLSERQLTRVCNLWPYVSWVDEDTDETIADAKMNNARKKGFCGD